VRPLVRTACALAVALTIAACGHTYTKADFIARADAICASAIEQIRSVPPPSFGSSQAQQMSGLSLYLAKVVPIVESEAAQLRGLHHPGGSASERADLERYLTAVSQAASDYKALSAAASRQDPQGVANAEADLRASPVGSLAATYGLRTCGSPGPTVG
jgi:hypothetical protein